jgi:hypothetical protein
LRFNGARRVVQAIFAIAVSTIALVVAPVAASAAPTALPNYQIALSPSAAIPPGGAAATYAQCPSGTHVVGGGMYSDYTQNPAAVVWRSSYPAHQDGVDRWGSQVHNTGQQPFTFRVYAVCLGGLSQYEVREHTATIRAGAGHGLGAGCPDPISELGGGFDVETGWGFRVNGVLDWATSSGYYRGVAGTNTSTQDQQWAAYVVCGSGGMAEVQLVRPLPTTVAPGIAVLDVSCPAGMSVLGGGGGSGLGSGAALLGSYPLSNTQWRSILRVDDPAGVSTEKWASCAR